MLACLAAAWALPIAMAMIDDGDYRSHVAAAVDLARGIVRVPHVLFHSLVAGAVLAGFSPGAAGVAATVALQAGSALAVGWYIRVATPDTPALTTILSSLAVLLCGPILPPGTDRDLYMTGYFLPNAIHNPTVIAAKPFVPLVLSIGASSVGLTTRPAWSAMAAAPVTMLAALGKPHYVSCMVAAAGAWSGIRAVTGRVVNVTLLALGLIVPAILVLGSAYWMVQSMPGEAAAVFAPLAVVRYYVAVDAVSLVQRLVSDLAFPIAVVVCWPAVVRRVPAVSLAWTAYAVALGQAYLLAESGPRFYDGNFLWSAQLATFALFAVSVAALPQLRQRDPASNRARVAVPYAVLALHVAYGWWWLSPRVPAEAWRWALVPLVVLAALALIMYTRKMFVTSIPVRTIVLVIACLAAGCRQPEGEIPSPAGEQANKTDDISRDLLAVAQRSPGAEQDLASDLQNLTGSVPQPALVDELSTRVRDAIAGTTLTDETAKKLATQLYVALAGSELSERQIDVLQRDIVSTLGAAGVPAEKAEPVGAAARELQVRVTRNPRRWWQVR